MLLLYLLGFCFALYGVLPLEFFFIGCSGYCYCPALLSFASAKLWVGGGYLLVFFAEICLVKACLWLQLVLCHPMLVVLVLVFLGLL
jgi:hypothetical protein